MGIVKDITDLISDGQLSPILREKLVTANAQVAALQHEHDALQVENEELKQKIRNLEGQLSERHGARLPEVQERLLVLNAAEFQYVKRTAKTLGLNEQVVLHHFEELRRRNMVEVWGEGTGDDEWHLLPEGRSYLVRHGLLT